MNLCGPPPSSGSPRVHIASPPKDTQPTPDDTARFSPACTGEKSRKPRHCGEFMEWAIQDSNLGPLPYQKAAESLVESPDLEGFS
jgi:hypothetical protein